MYESLIGRRVIVRANMAGVYVGLVTEAHPDGVTLGAGCRQLHCWATGGSVSQIAERGIGHAGSRVTSLSSTPRLLAGGGQVVSVFEMTDLAWDRVMTAPDWTGGM